MNSVEALDFALNVLRNRQRRLQAGTPNANPTAAAIETLAALREVVIDNDQALTEEREERQQEFANAHLAGYINDTCIACFGTDRVLATWKHNDFDYVRVCINCRRAIIRNA